MGGKTIPAARVELSPTGQDREAVAHIAYLLAAERFLDEGPDVPVDQDLARRTQRLAIRLVRVGWGGTAKESQVRLAEEIDRYYGDASYVDAQVPRSRKYQRWHFVFERELGHFARRVRGPGGPRTTAEDLLEVLVKNVLWHAPEARSEMVLPVQPRRKSKALEQLRELLFTAKGCRVAEPGKKPGGGLMSPWRAGALIARTLGGQMPLEKSDTRRKRNRA
jgi:hypothetical protein